jgi:hypothetical protein
MNIMRHEFEDVNDNGERVMDTNKFKLFVGICHQMKEVKITENKALSVEIIYYKKLFAVILFKAKLLRLQTKIYLN